VLLKLLALHYIAYFHRYIFFCFSSFPLLLFFFYYTGFLSAGEGLDLGIMHIIDGSCDGIVPDDDAIVILLLLYQRLTIIKTFYHSIPSFLFTCYLTVFACSRGTFSNN